MLAVLYENFYFAVCTAIVVIYQVLNKYPLVFRKRTFLGKKGFAQIIGHRGSREEGLPENTVAAFKDAISNGAEIIELGKLWMIRADVVHYIYFLFSYFVRCLAYER
jgi:hypothetical protein